MAALSSKLTRKGFLKGMGTMGIGVVASQALDACGTPTAAPTPQVVTQKETVVVEKVATVQVAAKGAVRVPVASWSAIVNDVRYAFMASQYNSTQDKVIIQTELLPAGNWVEKIAAQVKDNSVRICALLYANSYSSTPQFAGTEMTQSIDGYINSSQIPGAQTRIDQMWKPARPNATYKGKLYGLPIGVQYSSQTMRRDYATSAGYTGDITKSWDEVTTAATLIRKKFKDKGVVGLSLEPEQGNGTLSYMLWSYTDEPFIKVPIKGQQISMLNYQGDAFIKVLKQVKAWQEADLTPAKVMDDDESLWNGGAGIAQLESSLAYYSALPLFGKDNVYPSVPFPLSGGTGCITYYVNNVIVNKAPYPQEAVDFLLWADDPKNDAFMEAILGIHWYPVFPSVVQDKMQKDDRFKFMMVWGPLIDKSVPYPNDHPYYNINTDLINKHATKFWSGEYKSAEECAAALDNDARATTAKQIPSQ